MPLLSTSNASTGKGAGITTRSCRAALKAENTKQTCVAAPDAEVAVALMQQPEGMNVVCLFDGHGTGGMAPHEAAWAAPQMLQDSTALGKLLG